MSESYEGLRFRRNPGERGGYLIVWHDKVVGVIVNVRSMGQTCWVTYDNDDNLVSTAAQRDSNSRLYTAMNHLELQGLNA